MLTALLRLVKRPFLLLLLMETALFVGMVGCRRVPREHDGFGYFGTQYFFLNNAAMTGKLPQWVPYLMQGTVASWWYAVQGGFFVNSIALLAGPLGVLKGLNFLPFFYLGIWFDELILLVGAWLLARRLFRSPATAFFVCSIVVGPCIWMNQPWYNLHFFYALPLILALVHRFFDCGSWLSLFLAMNLFALQTVGNLPYYIPVSSLVIVLYFVLYTGFNWQSQLAAVRDLRFGLPAALTLLTGLGGLAIAFLILRVGAAEIANYSPGRGLDARVTLGTFLTYGGEITARKWLELFLGVSPGLDNTLYMGMLALPLLAVGCYLSLRQRCGHVLVLCGLLFFFGLGGFTAAQFYRFWPLMKYYRHIGLTGSMTRVFLCFVAGYGFEAVFLAQMMKRSQRVATVLLAAGLSVLAIGLFYLAANPVAADWALRAMRTQTATYLFADPAVFPTIFNPRVLTGRLAVSGCLAVLGGAILACRGLFSSQMMRKPLAALALVVVLSDVYIYKCGEVGLRTISMPSQDMALFDFQEMPYRLRRTHSFFDPNPRVDALRRDFVFAGIRHESACSFAFVDEVGSSLKVDNWLLPLDQLLRAWRGQDINDRTVRLVGLSPRNRLEFPQQEAALKLAGVMADKVQFFRRVHVLSSDTEIAARMSDPHYKGNVLFVSPGNRSIPDEDGFASETSFDDSYRFNGAIHPDADDRVELDYSVEQFDANNLVLTVQNTTKVPVWLLFSDVWHPGWSATVDGQEAPVYRGALAYKAVQLPPESSRVHFRFAVPGLSSLYFLLGLWSVLWLGILAVFAARACRSLEHGCHRTQAKYCRG